MGDFNNFTVRTTKPILNDNWASGVYPNANSAWENLYYGLNKDGEESSPRGLKIRENLGCNIYILNPADNLVYNSFRHCSPSYIANEFSWYLSGDRKVESISKYSKFWTNIANDDGTVNSNYGAYIFDNNYYPVDGKSQWDQLIDLLRKDPDSRQAILQIPITQFKGTKDVCCTSSLQFFIRNNKLNMITYMRSNDIYLGFCNDIPFFTGLQMMLAHELKCDLGWYRHVVGSLHVYENHFLEIEEEKNNSKFEFESIEDNDYNKTLQDMLEDYVLIKKEYDENIDLSKYNSSSFRYMIYNSINKRR